MIKNTWTIFKKEFNSYFETAMGYIYLIVFLLVSVGLYITPFFTYPRADMRAFFSLLPIFLCVFMPAITMRQWAEERKANTLEMLLTFPMRPIELVMGKFFGSLAFYCLALIGTGTIPLMLISLGSPDLGTIFSAYLGAVLLGGFFLSLGLFISGLSKDQIVSFVVTMMFCFGLFLIGTNFFATYFDNIFAGLGSFLSVVAGVTTHFEAFGRGVIELGNILFFLVWIVIFLILNGLGLERRHRPGAQMIFNVAIVMCLTIGLLLNWLLVDRSLGRYDMTENKIYTISSAAKDILATLKVPVQVKLYITPKDKMPTEMKRIEQDVADKLKDIRQASGGAINFRVVHMEAANVINPTPQDKNKEEQKDEKEESLEQSLMEKGVRPFSVQALREDQATTQLVYSSIGIAYKDKPEEIIPNIVPSNVSELEYKLLNVIYKLNLENSPKIALVAPMSAVSIDPQMAKIYEQLGMSIPTADDPYAPLQQVLQVEKYEVNRVKFNKEQPIPQDSDTLVIVDPENLSRRQLWEINRALVEGKSVFIAVQTYNWDYRLQGNQLSISKIDRNSGINNMLNFGVSVREDILMDINHLPLTVRTSRNPMANVFGGSVTLNLPTQIMLNQSSMNPEVAITSHLSNIFYLWGSALKIDEQKIKDNNLKVTELFYTSKEAWTRPAKHTLEQADLEPPESGGEQYPLAVLITGQFPDAFKGQKIPEWPSAQPPLEDPTVEKVEEETPELKPAPGKLIIVACGQMFNKNFLSQGVVDFYLNSVDVLSLGDKLVEVRSKKPINRMIDKPSNGTRNLWKFINLALVNILIAAVGIIIAGLRRKARNAYTIAHKS